MEKRRLSLTNQDTQLHVHFRRFRRAHESQRRGRDPEHGFHRGIFRSFRPLCLFDE